MTVFCPLLLPGHDPFVRDRDKRADYYKHHGIYAYRRDFLRTSPPCLRDLERLEALEQLRVLENGYRIRVVITPTIPLRSIPGGTGEGSASDHRRGKTTSLD